MNPNPGAPVSARKTVQKAKRAPNAARGAQSRKRLKETEAEHEEQRQRWDDGEERILRAVSDAAWEVYVKAHHAGASSTSAFRKGAAILDIVGLAAEAAAAKALGYESWAAFEAAQAERELA